MRPPPQIESEQASKGSMLRGYIDALRRAGMFEAVRARVSPELAPILDEPPPSSSWVRWQDTDELILAIEAVGGLAAVRNITRDAMRVGLAPMLRAAIEGFLRLFGASPASLLARLGQLTSTSSRGVNYEYTSTSEHSGVMVVSYPSRRNMPPALFAAATGGFEALYDLVGVKGTVSEPELVANGQGNAVRYNLAWTPRR